MEISQYDGLREALTLIPNGLLDFEESHVLDGPFVISLLLLALTDRCHFMNFNHSVVLETMKDESRCSSAHSKTY